MKLSELKVNEKNPFPAEDISSLVEKIEKYPKFLELRPIVYDPATMVILGGNKRYAALKQLGHKEIPDEWVKSADQLTEKEKRAFIFADNYNIGTWDFEVIDDGEAMEWGIEMFEEEIELEASEDDYEMPDEIKTDIVLGDLFEIGEHRLLCGDSTDSDQVARLMDGKQSELLFTSPPYSDMREYNGEKDLSISNLVEFITSFYQYCAYQVVNLGIQRKDNNIVSYWDDYIEKAKDNGYNFLSWNIWDRINSGTMAQQTAMFGIVHEWIFVFGKKPKKLNRTLENKHSDAGTRKNKKVRQADGTHEETTAMFYDKKQLNTIYTCRYEMGSIRSLHPATFPIELPSEYIKAMTDVDDIVAEPFTGSGSTMVAAHQLNRKCYGMELDPKYCQVIVDRMMKLDESLTLKKNGKDITKEYWESSSLQIA